MVHSFETESDDLQGHGGHGRCGQSCVSVMTPENVVHRKDWLASTAAAIGQLRSTERLVDC